MRKFCFPLFIVLAMILSSCGGDSMAPVSEKIQGPLGPYFNVVSRNYKANNGKVFVEFKRVSEGLPAPWTKGVEVGYSDGKCEPHFTIEYQDADGNVLSKDKTDIVFDEDDLQALVSLGVGETSSIPFDCNKGARKFKIGSTFEFHGEEEKTVNLEGGIGKYPIMMTVHIASDGEVTGAYYYKKNGPGNFLYLKGEKDGERMILNEFNKKGKQTGTYEGSYSSDGVYKGHFNTKSGNYQFVLKPTNMKEIDFSDIDFDSFIAEYITYDEEESDSYDDNDDDYADIGDEDWDSLLNAYEKFVDQYVSFAKKAAKGDLKALADYPSLMIKAEKFSKRMEKMEDSNKTPSASQLARTTEISNKMMKAELEFMNAVEKFESSGGYTKISGSLDELEKVLDDLDDDD